MEKLEKHIKDRLEERKITPSAQAWDKIAAQIDTEEKPKQRGWYLYAIAASFIGILLVSIFFFKPEQPEGNTIPVEVVEDNNSKKDLIQPKEENINFKNKVQKESAVAEIDSNSTREDPSLDFKPVVLPIETEVAEETVKNPIQDSFLSDSNDLITQKVNEIVAQVTLLETTNEEVTDAEVDSLLRAAQSQILSEELFAENGAVDAMALLSEVEGELDGSFRDQIFDALKEGYFKLRTAVADRNN